MKKLMLILLIAACTVPKHGPPNPNSIVDAAQIDSLAKAFYYIEGSGDIMSITPDQWNYPPQWTNRYPTGIDTVYIHDTIYHCSSDTVWDHGISVHGSDTIMANVGLLSTTTTGTLTFDSILIFDSKGVIIHDHYYDSMTARKIYKDSMVRIYGKGFDVYDQKGKLISDKKVIKPKVIRWGLIIIISLVILWFIWALWLIKKTRNN